MFEDVLIEQNPHWENFKYPEGIHRECFEKIKDYLFLPHVISVTGVRRSGKSTLLKQLINFLIDHHNIHPLSIVFVNLEHPYFVQYSNDVRYLEKLFEDYLKISSPQKMIYCFLDEIQFFANWPVFVKAHYEQKNVKFVVTGSNSFLMSHDLLTLLSGRTLPVEVYPLSFSELVKAKTKIDLTNVVSVSRHRHVLRNLLDHYLQYGGFPEVALYAHDNVSHDILNAYSKTILYQDVAARLNLKKPLDLERLFYYLTSHIGTLFSYSSLAKIFNLSDKTIKEYITAFAEANLLFEIDKFSFSLQQQIRSSKKMYSIDMGMVNAFAFKFSESRGRLFENAIFLELRRKGIEVYHYKTRSDYEIDFVAKKREQIQLIQICVNFGQEKTQTREVRALIQAAQELNLKKGIIVTSDEEDELVVEGIYIAVIPLYKFIFMI
jgi:predicted AAA+ superfamily ATPase